MKIAKLHAALLATASLQVMASAPAFAQASDSDETIVVSARRIEERLQDVPISMSVVNEAQLAQANIVSTSDLARVVPGLNTQARFSTEQVTFTIRGFTQELRTSATVGTYFAEVVAPRGGGSAVPGGDGAGPGALFDLQNVQVLKGPQGTLFGRNTTGGAVLLVPRKPTDKLEGYIEGSYGNYDMTRVQAVVNAPLAEGVKLRLGADWQDRKGFIHNVSGIGPKDFADVNYIAVRGSLVLDLSPDIENYTIVSYMRSKNNGMVSQAFQTNPSGGLYRLGGLIAPQVARLNASGDPYQIEQHLANPIALTKQFQVINTTTWRASDSITIKNIMSYSSFIQDVRQDAFSTNASPIPNLYLTTSFIFASEGNHTNNQRNFTEELQLQGTGAEDKLQYQAGLYYEHSTPAGWSESAAPGTTTLCLLGFTSLATTRCLPAYHPITGAPIASAQSTLSKVEFTNMAAYAQATYALTEKLKATAGFRYTYDRTVGNSEGRVSLYLGNPLLGPVPPTFVACGLGFTGTGCSYTGRTSSDKPTWTLSLQYNPVENAMFYATYTRGYRQGSVSPAAPAGRPIFDPEKVDNYEIGTKATFDGAVSGAINLTGFYTKLANQQIQIGLQQSTGGNAISIYNAGASRIYGFEFDGSLRFNEIFRLNGAATYVNSQLESFVAPTREEFLAAGWAIVRPSAVAGDQLPFTPEWSANIGGTLTLPMDESMGKIELSATYRYSSSYTSNASTSTSIVSTPVKQIDLNLDWRNVGGHPVDLSLFGTNVTNQFTQGLISPFYDSLGYDVRYMGLPRMYGVRVRVRFGS